MVEKLAKNKMPANHQPSTSATSSGRFRSGSGGCGCRCAVLAVNPTTMKCRLSLPIPDLITEYERVGIIH